MLRLAALVLATTLLSCDRAPDALPAPAEPPAQSAPPAAVPAPPSTVAPPEADDDGPELAAYPASEVREVVVRRRGATAELVIRFDPVPRAQRYEVVAAKTMTFTGLATQVVAKRSPAKLTGLSPSVVFVRVRAVGPLGEGPWSAVRVVDATRAGKSLRSVDKVGAARLLAATEAARAVSETPAAQSAPQPLKVGIERPAANAIVSERSVSIEGVATAGALVRVGDQPPVSSTGTFKLTAALTPGKNRVVVTAQLAEQSVSVSRTIYFADPARLAPFKARFEALRRELDQIAALRAELDATARSLGERLRGNEAAALREELARIETTRRELDQEIARAMRELEKLM